MFGGPIEIGPSLEYGPKTRDRGAAAPVVGASAATPSTAASLELSERARRLALIPAQLMDAEQIAAARKEVQESEERLAQVRAGEHRAEQREVLDHLAMNVRDGGAHVRASEASSDPNHPVASSPEQEPPSRAPRSRPDQATLMHGRSPFESSLPGATGQSLDIVVGSST